MKIFWSVLLLVCLAAVAAIFWPVSNGSAKDMNDFAKATPPQSVAPTAAVGPIASTTTAATAITSATNSPTGSNATPATTSASAATNAAVPVVTATKKSTSPTVVISPDSLKDGLDRKLGNAVIVAGNILKQADGSILADNKYLISGAGTLEDPYRVTWECLTSASQTYIPRLQQNIIPQRVAMLDGKWIRIEGYMAFPLMLQESSEILAMLNQWDGCCIGVPPTPYDAIEVKLAVPVKPGRRHTYNFGTVTGKFKVDPYLVENWLVGLYQLESASLQSDM
jgi:hypothetical protein